MSKVTMQLQQKRSRTGRVYGQLFFIDNGVYIARRQIVLPLKKKIEVGRTNNIEGYRTELFLRVSRLSFLDEQHVKESFNQARTSIFMLVGRDRIQYTNRSVAGQFLC